MAGGVVTRGIVRGLNTAPGENVTAEAGALREASNVVFAQEGLATPRPGFGKLTGTYDDSSQQAVNLFPWPGIGGTDLVVLRNNTDDTVSWMKTPTAAIDDEGGADLAMVAAVQASRGNLYAACGDALFPQVRKFTSSAATAAALAGISMQPVVFSALSGGAGAVLVNDDRVAYRALTLKRDANDLVVRGPCTGHLQFRNVTGVTINPVVYVALPDDVVAGNVVEVYRTRGVAAAPGNDFYLAYSRELSASDISAKSFSFTDIIEDADLGAALYTNDSREGVMGSNFRPPACAVLASFRESMFFGLVAGPARLQLTWSEGGVVTGAATGIGSRATVCDFTDASNQITNVVTTTGLQVGMLLENTTGWSATPCRITAIAGTTITMSGTRTGTAVGTTATFIDSIRIGSEYFPVDSAALFMLSLSTARSSLSVPSTTFHAYALGKYAQRNTTTMVTVENLTVVIEERLREGQEESVYATHGDEYFPPLPLPNATATDIAQTRYDRFNNGLVWSKQYEPEHVPLSYFVEVGSKDHLIVALVPTRDALWIFKTDGIWRLTGTAAPGWRIDPYDPTIRLLHYLTITKMNDRIYAWTNRGVIEVGDGVGVRVISGPIETRLSLAQSKMQVAATYGALDHGIWLASDPNHGIVLVGVSETLNQGYAKRIYCFNVDTRQWSEWRMPFSLTGEDPAGFYTGITHMVYDERTGRLVAGTINTTEDVIAARVEREEDPPWADYSYTANVTVTTALDGTYGTNLLVNSGTWVPALGDVFTHSGVTYIVKTEHSATRCVVTPATAIVSQNITAYSAYEVELSWQRFGSIGVQSQVREVTFGFDESRGIERVTADLSNENGVAYEQQATRAITYRSIDTDEKYPRSIRVLPSRAVARSVSFFPTLKFSAARAPFSVSGVTATTRPYTSRVQR